LKFFYAQSYSKQKLSRKSAYVRSLEEEGRSWLPDQVNPYKEKEKCGTHGPAPRRRDDPRNCKEEHDFSPKISIRKERGVIRASMVLDGPCRGGEVRYLGVNGMKAGPTRPRSTSFAAPPAPPAGAPRTPPRPPSFRPLEGAPLPGPPHRLRRRRCAVIAPRPRRSDPRGTGHHGSIGS